MKKRFAVIALVLALVLSLTACGGKTDSKTITVGATPAPHAQILEIVKEILAEEGYTLVIREFDDYVPGLTSEQVRDFIVGIKRQLPHPIRIEQDTEGWVHVDVRNSSATEKIVFFKG